MRSALLEIDDKKSFPSMRERDLLYFGDMFVFAEYEDETKGYLGAFTTADVKQFRRQNVVLDIDGKQFPAKAIGTKSRKLQGNYKGSYVPVHTRALADALAGGTILTVVPAKSFSFELPLDGLGAAMAEGSACIKAQS